jgi:hypothetical protein
LVDDLAADIAGGAGNENGHGLYSLRWVKKCRLTLPILGVPLT